MMRNTFDSQIDVNEVNLISNNLLRLEIFYKEFNYEEIQEAPAYPVHGNCSRDNGSVLFVHGRHLRGAVCEANTEQDIRSKL